MVAPIITISQRTNLKLPLKISILIYCSDLHYIRVWTQEELRSVCWIFNIAKKSTRIPDWNLWIIWNLVWMCFTSKYCRWSHTRVIPKTTEDVSRNQNKTPYFSCLCFCTLVQIEWMDTRGGGRWTVEEEFNCRFYLETCQRLNQCFAHETFESLKFGYYE